MRCGLVLRHGGVRAHLVAAALVEADFAVDVADQRLRARDHVIVHRGQSVLGLHHLGLPRLQEEGQVCKRRGVEHYLAVVRVEKREELVQFLRICVVEVGQDLLDKELGYLGPVVPRARGAATAVATHLSGLCGVVSGLLEEV